MALKPIEIVINAKDNASKVFDGLNAKLKAVAAAVAAYIGINAFANVVKGAADFEEAMDRVQDATNASGEELAQLKAAAEAAGATTKFTAIEAASALENLAKAGLNGKEAIAALPAVMSMAQAGGVSLADASERLTGVVMGMGLAFTESGRVADVLAMGANASRTSITGLAEAMSYAAPVAKTVGLSLESTTAIIGQFANAGIDASRAGTALNSILSQFSDPASKFRQELLALGISTGNFDEALKQLAATGPRGASAVRAVGLEAGPALQAALNLGIPALEELRKKLQESAGSAEATAKVMGDNLNGALKGLSSAWDAVKNTLGEPVLPVLKSGVEQLSGALQAAVADGTIAKFGAALSSTFQAAMEWVRQFVASVNFDKVGTDMQAFATRAGEVFDQIGQYATNAGNIVKLAYGVMSAGTNAVLTGIYGLGGAFSEVAEQVMLGVAKLRDGLASVTFGKLSEDFKLAANDARLMAQGFGEAAQAMRDKAAKSLGDVAEGAQLARDGFEGLSTEAGRTKAAADAGAQSMDTLAEAMRKEAEASYAAQDAAEKKAEATQKSKAAADEARAAVAALREEYAKEVALGNLERAVEIQRQINEELKKTGPAAAASGKAVGAMADEVAAAYKAMGITTSAELASFAADAKSKYDLVKSSGIGTAEDIAKAFEFAAQKAIAANKGLAPVWVQAEAAARGYRIETDAAGKQTVVAMADAKGAIDGVAGAHHGAASAARSHAMSVEEIARKYSDAGAQAQAAAGQFMSAAKAQKDADTSNSSITKTQGGMGPLDQVPEFESIAEAEAWKAEWLKAYWEQNRGIDPGQLGRIGLDLMEMEYKAALNNVKTKKAMQEARDREVKEQERMSKTAEPPAQSRPSPSGVPAPIRAPDPAPAPRQPQQSGGGGSAPGAMGGLGNTYISNVTLSGATTQLRFADQQSQQAAEQLLGALAAGKRVAQ